LFDWRVKFQAELWQAEGLDPTLIAMALKDLFDVLEVGLRVMELARWKVTLFQDHPHSLVKLAYL